MGRGFITPSWSVIGPTFAVLGGIAATGAVVVWALAAPLRDPVGDAMAWTDKQWSAALALYDAGPVNEMRDWQAARLQVLNGNAELGRAAMLDYGCGACHVIPGVSGARGTVGPSLAAFANRAYVAGILTNAPGDLTRWLIDPPLFAPDTAMPDLNVTEADAANIAAYLYTLGQDG